MFVVVTFAGKPVSGATVDIVIDGKTWNNACFYLITTRSGEVNCDPNTSLDTLGLHSWYATASLAGYTPGRSPTYWWYY
jgi:hypothetical protein